ncbi:hypothetical protein LSAT2_012204, partial [Lamellibrachia satsuma]
PNLLVSLRTLLIMCVSLASCESFSKHKLIKAYLRSSMGQKRLSSIALLSNERELTNVVNFDCVIVEFVALKARK